MTYSAARLSGFRAFEIRNALIYKRFSFLILGLAAMALLLAGCGGGPAPSMGAASAAPLAAEPDYRLGAGDRLRLIVFDEPNLSGEFDISGSGRAALPLIGQVEARGLTLSEFEDAVETKLRNGYLTNPRVSAEVINYRPFYIIGEVTKPGEYPYTDGMTVLNAVAVAGGYTYRADDSRVFITRENAGGEREVGQLDALKVQPGDVIRVPERYF
ncbi:polysaccharide biosynthesis/export family protein [Parvibaculum sp.]|jgi:polysaccharide export outer membrane protein|uniref:polysaccharide biosynthesis/export family protein n=2 Tax=Parvibaculum sp. TaxID=2024848 RepID=UPI002FDA8375